MAEYIEREAAVRMAVEATIEIFDCHTTLSLLKIANKIRTIPTADVVEVVRCKDCRYRYFNQDCESYGCENIAGLPDFVNDNDYCSYGVKKEGAEE